VAEYSTSTDVANRALQLVGAGLISSITANTRNAVQANFLYDKLRVAELRAHVWSFAITYGTMTSSVLITYFNGATRNALTLPSDFLRLANQDPRVAGNAAQVVSGGARFTDLTIEGGKLVTARTVPVTIRYVKDFTNVLLMDSLFIETLALHMAVDLCEVLTNSLQKKQLLAQEYTEALNLAHKINLIEAASDEPSEMDFKDDRLLREKLPPQLAQQQARQR
jgi:hypothetical protein